MCTSPGARLSLFFGHTFIAAQKKLLLRIIDSIDSTALSVGGRKNLNDSNSNQSIYYVYYYTDTFAIYLLPAYLILF